MKRLVFTLLAFVFLLPLIVMPVLAQEPTPEATAVAPVYVVTDNASGILNDAGAIVIHDAGENNPVLVAVIVVMGVIIVFLLSAVVYLAQKGFDALPKWAQGMAVYNEPKIKGAVSGATHELVEAAESTPNELDDAIAGYVDKRVNAAVDKLFSYFESKVAERAASNTPLAGQSIGLTRDVTPLDLGDDKT